MSGIQAYRNLLRSAGIAFHGDVPVMTAAKQEIRRNFDASRDLTPEEAVTKVQHAHDVALVLRKNVVQGRRKESDDGTYDLRIHKDIELGDNETIRRAKSNPSASKNKCCSS